MLRTADPRTDSLIPGHSITHPADTGHDDPYPTGCLVTGIRVAES